MIRFLCVALPILLFGDWAEDVLAKMSLEEKVGQLFMAPACPLRGEEHWADWLALLEECHIGNAIVKHSDSVTQVKFLNRLQQASDIPVLVAADAEWGLGMRMSDAISFPRNMTLGALSDVGLIEEMGAEIGRQAKQVGIHMNLAPVADVNNNPANPIIHMRSFGENPHWVAECVAAYAKGLQKGGVLACAKHFPGHGDTSVDSHRDLPVIAHSRERLDAVEFVPFKRAIAEGIDALMTAHLYVPAIDESVPTSLSKACMTGIARNELGFQGLIISDALNMRAIADRYTAEEIAILARKAGCDLLLYGDHRDPNIDEIMRDLIPRGFRAVKEAYQSGELDLGELDQTVLRILRVKEGIVPCAGNLDLHSEEAIALKQRLFQEAVTVVGEDVFSLAENTVYWNVGDVFAEEGDLVVVSIYHKEALTEEVVAQIEAMGERAIVCLFASPYLLKHFKNVKTVVVGYENDPDAERAVLNVLKGREKAKGHLPVSIDGP